ncbi:MAG: hypothetical protein LBJ67_03235 [Planctomycetaceae bacterium]|nr:hypothetical protein [Planctomycetaceae bacterium]
MSKFCPHCGESAHDENAVICPKTGLPLGGGKTPKIGNLYSDFDERKQGWNVGLFILFIVLTIFVPLVGLILGGINLSPSKNTEGRRGQAIALFVLGIFMCIVNAILIIGNNANNSNSFDNENVTIVKPLD